MSEIFIQAEQDGIRLDLFLSQHLSDVSRSAAQRLLEEEAVTLNGKVVRKNHRVTAGETFRVTLPDITVPQLEPEDIPLEIVYEDDDLIAINKQRGMVVHPAPGHPNGTLVNALLYHCKDTLSGIGGERRPGIVHRLDKDTSGLILCAKNDFTHMGLAAQLATRSLSRIYEAVVTSRVKEEQGTVNAPIGRHHIDRKRMSVTHKNSRNAVTHYTVLDRYQGYTHIRCQLETGRTHQIRVHMAHIGHPLLGDFVYGRKKEEKGIIGQCLHARTLKFVHPRTAQQIELSTPLPDYFEAVLHRLGNKI